MSALLGADRQRCMATRNVFGNAIMAAASVIAVVGGSIGLAGPASALHYGVAPGDTIRYVSADGEASTCTLGFVFSDGTRTLAVTAGHCVGDGRGYVYDSESGHSADVVSHAYDPDMRGPDYALLDFGDAPIGDFVFDADLSLVRDPLPRQVICHTGAGSGSSCGELVEPYGEQFLIVGDTSSGGDSGGPVFTDRLTAVGIWLGSYKDRYGTKFGRFYPLPAALEQLGVTTAMHVSNNRN